MAGKIAWVFFIIAMIGAIVAAFTGPFDLNVVSITSAAIAITLGLFGLYFAFASWKEK